MQSVSSGDLNDIIWIRKEWVPLRVILEPGQDSKREQILVSLWDCVLDQRLWENSLPSRAFQMCNFLNMYAWKTASKEQPIQNYWCTTTTGRTFWTVMKHILTFRFFKTLCVVFHIVSVAYKNFLIVSPVYKTNQSGQSSLSVYKLLGKCNFQVHLQKNKIN